MRNWLFLQLSFTIKQMGFFSDFFSIFRSTFDYLLSKCKWWTQINVLKPLTCEKSLQNPFKWGVWNLSFCHEIPCITMVCKKLALAKVGENSHRFSQASNHNWLRCWPWPKWINAIFKESRAILCYAVLITPL